MFQHRKYKTLIPTHLNYILISVWNLLSSRSWSAYLITAEDGENVVVLLDTLPPREYVGQVNPQAHSPLCSGAAQRLQRI